MSIHLKKGDQVEAIIEKIAFGGEGVARIAGTGVKGLVLFVPFSAEGDRLRVRISSVKKNFARGEISEILAPSPFRTRPRCRHFSRCGGCHYQHISYDRQLHIKKEQVVDAYQRIGGVMFAVDDCIACPSHYGYRGKAEFHAEYEAGSGLLLGLMAPRSNRTLAIDRCEIMDESINRAYSVSRTRLKKERKTPSEEDLIFWSDQSGIHGKGKAEIKIEPGLITRQVKGRSFLTPYGGFFQANIHLIDTLVDTVLERSELNGSETLIDIFSGSGLFSLFAADRCRRVYGSELDPQAVACAVMNAEKFGISHVNFLEGSAEETLKQFKAKGIHPDVAIIDPPRIGCDPGVVTEIIELAPERIVYVSCDPVTQARDIALFLQRGYHLKRIQPIDMFPQTKHIEVIASLNRGGWKK